jgi:hypothetical protein
MQKGVELPGLTSGPAPNTIDEKTQTTGDMPILGSNQEPTMSKPSSGGGAEDARGGGCPMKRSDGSYSFSWTALSRGFQHPNVAAVGNKPAASDTEGSISEEPAAKPGVEPAEEGKCPVRAKQRVPEYNVYSQPIDSSNQMPGSPNQLPAPQQSQPLSTERVVSNIPKVRVVCCGTRLASPLNARGNPVCVLFRACTHVTFLCTCAGWGG